MDKINLGLWPDSWQNIFECLHANGTVIKSVGNFWAAIQELERQFGYIPAEIPAFEPDDFEETETEDATPNDVS